MTACQEKTNRVFVLKSGVPDHQKVEQEKDNQCQRHHVQLEVIDDDEIDLHTRPDQSSYL